MPPPLPTPVPPGGIAPARLCVCAAARTHHCTAAWAGHRAQGTGHSTHSGGRTAAGPEARQHHHHHLDQRHWYHRYQLHGSTSGTSWNTGTAAGKLKAPTLRIEYLCYHYAIISALFRAITLCFKQNESFVYNPNILQT